MPKSEVTGPDNPDYGKFPSGKKASRFRSLAQKALSGNLTVNELIEWARLYVMTKGELPDGVVMRRGRLVYGNHKAGYPDSIQTSWDDRPGESVRGKHQMKQQEFCRYAVISLCLDEGRDISGPRSLYVREDAFASPKLAREFFQRVFNMPSRAMFNGKEIGVFLLPDGTKAKDISLGIRMARARFNETTLEIEGEFD